MCFHSFIITFLKIQVYCGGLSQIDRKYISVVFSGFTRLNPGDARVQAKAQRAPFTKIEQIYVTFNPAMYGGWGLILFIRLTQQLGVERTFS